MNVEFVTERPPSGPFVMVTMGGYGQQIGLGGVSRTISAIFSIISERKTSQMARQVWTPPVTRA